MARQAPFHADGLYRRYFLITGIDSNLPSPACTIHRTRPILRGQEIPRCSSPCGAQGRRDRCRFYHDSQGLEALHPGSAT